MIYGETEEEHREHMNCHRRVENALTELKAQMKAMQSTVEKVSHTLLEDDDSLMIRVAIIENKVADLVWLKTAVFSVVICSIGQLLFLALQMIAKK